MPQPAERRRSRHRAPRLPAAARLQLCAVAGILTWGVLAFGAVYPWGYRPLAAGCAVTGVLALASRRARAALPRAVVVALVVVAAAAMLQTISLPRDILHRISPAASAVLAQYDVSFAHGSAMPHAVSIDPGRTWVSILLLGAFAVFWMGLTGVLDEALAVRLVQAVVALGFVVAIVAIAFAGTQSGKVYGFWQPRSPGAPFGPFVNRNHFAGWMLMSVLAGFGYFCGLLKETAQSGSSLRKRVLWLSSPQANQLIYVAIALVVMTLSILMSMSRSGIACVALGIGGVGLLQLRTVSSRWARAAFLSAVIAFGAVSIAWAGVDALAARFTTWQDESLAGRVGVWRDARTVLQQFPVTGTGLNTFGVAMLFYQSSHLHELYAEAHNDYLQLAAEGGMLVGLPVLALLGVTVVAVRRRLREPGNPLAQWIRIGAVTGIIAVAIQDLGDFSLQMPGTAALFCVLAAITLARFRESQAA